MTAIEIKEKIGVDFVLRSLGTYLKVPAEVKSKFGFEKDIASPKVTASQEKGNLILTYVFPLDKENKIKKIIQ